MSRLPPQPGELIDRTRTAGFSFDGREIAGFAGDTIASALFAAGQRTFSRSFKYHRRRGLLCCAGQCPNCLVSVDGAPGVRACTEPLREGMRVEHMNAWPSLEHDAMSLVGRATRPFTPPGFYYKTFIRPRRLWPLYERALRKAAGLGRAPVARPQRDWRTDYRRRHADVLVIGGGSAGLAAATRAAELGADVVLVDEGPAPGGQLLVEGRAVEAEALVAAARDAGVELLYPASALGHFDGITAVWHGDVLHQIRAARHVMATGAIEQPLVFEHNDLPGIMLSGAARRLAALYAVTPGSSAVLTTTNDRGIEAALALRDVGVELRAVADLRASADGPALERLRAAGVEIVRSATVVRANGKSRVTGALLAEVDSAGAVVAGSERSFDCDLLLVSGGHAPAGSLLWQAAAGTAYDPRGAAFAPGSTPPDMLAAGDVAGVGPADAARLSGRVAGAATAHLLGLGNEGSRADAARDQRGLEAARSDASPVAEPPAAMGARHGSCYACLCEDVTAKDMRVAVDEGYDSLELAKRYTTATMGPCQGRMCGLAAARLMAAQAGDDVAQVGTTTSRPPWSTVPLGVLAGRPLEPAKRSSIHARHRELGANVMWAGDWRRPYDYGDPEGEALAVHEAAGLIDVSTLGKLIVRGPDAGEFLDRLYPNRLSNLDVGRIRYGVLGSDAGRILDDGTICRLDEDSFYVTTTSSGAEAVEQWFSWWLAEWGLRARLTDLTAALAAVNLAGPHSRAILKRLTELDCSNHAFSYLDGKTGHVAGVPSLLLRIGFVGELGYEIHLPSAHGEHVWDALLDAGRGLGVRPFGLEPQRVLRLQKMHILVGQDTDSESDPFGASMPWIVKLDKEGDFVGRWALEESRARDGGPRLVGFSVPAGSSPVEGAAVVVGGHAVGRVTSSRYSRQLESAIGLAWVPGELAGDGTEIAIADNGRRLVGTVTTSPFFDPGGTRLRA